MARIDIQHREVTLKLVYYGPALSGKTTNLQQLYRMMKQSAESEPMTLDTRDDRTLFFDLLPFVFPTRAGLKIRVKLFTVPGQVIHDATRRVVLQGVDGVAFVADSRVTETRNNNGSFANLKRNLRENGIRYDDIGVVIQFNKRDLSGIRSDIEVEQIARKGPEPVFKASALHGLGVQETFLGLAESTWRKLEERYAVAEQFGIQEEELIAQLAASMISRAG